MGRNEELQVNVPSYFRCPISLDVMKSPVSLCTGVTYDRSSIQRWLEEGNNTCPATMQVLPTTDLVPNHTLHRLIKVWSHPAAATTTTSSATAGVNPATACCSASDLLRHLQTARDPLLYLKNLANIAGESDGASDLAELPLCIPALKSVLIKEEIESEARQEAVSILDLVLDAQKGSFQFQAKSLADSTVLSSITAVLREGKRPDFKSKAARVLDSISSIDTESKLLVADAEGLLPELVNIVIEGADPKSTAAALSCLASLSASRRVCPRIVRLGLVPALGKLLSSPSSSSSTAEMALKLLEAASTCTEGRAAICDDAGVVVAGVVGRMMKVPVAATEHGVVVLWSICHVFRDRRAQEAVVASNGLTKLLLLMQSNCSPAARQMARDLVKIFKVNSKSCLASYDTKTTHIMPF